MYIMSPRLLEILHDLTSNLSSKKLRVCVGMTDRRESGGHETAGNHELGRVFLRGVYFPLLSPGAEFAWRAFSAAQPRCSP
jgi:hypothetical protein